MAGFRRGIDGTEEEQHTDLCLYQCLFPHRAKIQESRPGFDHHIWRTSFNPCLEFPSPARLSRMPHHHTQYLARLSWLSPSTSSPTGPAATIVTKSWSEDFPIGYGAKPAASDHCPTLAPAPTISGVQSPDHLPRPASRGANGEVHGHASADPKPDRAMKIPQFRASTTRPDTLLGHKLSPLSSLPHTGCPSPMLHLTSLPRNRLPLRGTAGQPI